MHELRGHDGVMIRMKTRTVQHLTLWSGAKCPASQGLESGFQNPVQLNGRENLDWGVGVTIAHKCSRWGIMALGCIACQQGQQALQGWVSSAHQDT